MPFAHKCAIVLLSTDIAKCMSGQRLPDTFDFERRTHMASMFFLLAGGLLIIIIAVVISVVSSVVSAVAADQDDAED